MGIIRLKKLFERFITEHSKLCKFGDYLLEKNILVAGNIVHISVTDSSTGEEIKSSIIISDNDVNLISEIKGML